MAEGSAAPLEAEPHMVSQRGCLTERPIVSAEAPSKEEAIADSFFNFVEAGGDSVQVLQLLWIGLW